MGIPGISIAGAVGIDGPPGPPPGLAVMVQSELLGHRVVSVLWAQLVNWDTLEAPDLMELQDLVAQLDMRSTDLMVQAVAQVLVAVMLL